MRSGEAWQDAKLGAQRDAKWGGTAGCEVGDMAGCELMPAFPLKSGSGVNTDSQLASLFELSPRPQSMEWCCLHSQWAFPCQWT